MPDPAPTILFVWSTGIPILCVISEPMSCVGSVQIFYSCRLVTETSILRNYIQDAAGQHTCHNFCTHMRRWLLLCRNRILLRSCGYLDSQTSKALSTNTRSMSTFAGLKLFLDVYVYLSSCFYSSQQIFPFRDPAAVNRAHSTFLKCFTSNLAKFPLAQFFAV